MPQDEELELDRLKTRAKLFRENLDHPEHVEAVIKHLDPDAAEAPVVTDEGVLQALGIEPEELGPRR